MKCVLSCNYEAVANNRFGENSKAKSMDQKENDSKQVEREIKIHKVFAFFLFKSIGERGLSK